MARSRRSKSLPKIGRKWTYDDLLAYNITIVYEDLETFFGVTDLPPPKVENDARTAQDFALTAEAWTNSFLNNLNRLKSILRPDQTLSCTMGYILDLFRKVPLYTDPWQHRLALMRYQLRYLGSQGKPPALDYCIRDRTEAVILVVRVARPFHGFEPEPRIISDAIAAFHNDNVRRTNDLGTDPVAEKVMPGIVMDGTVPSFYKIPVTPELVTAVLSGKCPEEETVVHAYRPELPTPGEGMGAPDNRTVLLSCLEAFEKFL